MRVTMEDIARMAGVSKATVSRVVNGIEQGVGPETRRRVLQIVKETNYRSYSLPSQNQSKTLGLIIPDIINPFFGELVKAIEGEATEQGYTVLLGNTDFSMEKEERYLSIFLAKRVDGIILVTTAQTAGEHYQRLKKYSVPCVLVDRMLAGAEYTAGIFVDNSYALFMACSLLIQHRNEKIALISGPRNISTSVERIQGYRDALEQYRLPFEERLIKYGDYTFESGYRAIMELEREGTRFTGVLAANDTMALGAIKALKELTYAIAVLYLGEVIEYSTSEELYHNPRHPYTKELLRSIPQISGDARLSTANREPPIELPSPIRPPSGCRYHPRCPYRTENCSKHIPAPALVGRDHIVKCHRCAAQNQPIEPMEGSLI